MEVIDGHDGGDGRTWQTTIDELMAICRDALAALIPALERAKIAWRRPDAYDDWDAIAEAIFYNIVVRTIRWSLLEDKKLTDATISSKNVPRYGLRYPDYGALSFVEVVPLVARPSSYLVFVDFQAQASAFDTVSCCLIDAAGKVIDDSPQELAITDVRFRFQYRASDGELVSLEKLSLLV